MNNTSFDGYAEIAGMNTADAITSIASNIGTASDLGKAINGVNAQNSVNKNIAVLNEAIGDIAGLKETIYTSEATNLTDAVKMLDNNIYRLDYRVSDLNYKYQKLRREFKAGMASVAAMTALAPNARADGNTQLSIGTSAYSGRGAVAVGGFHWVNNNLMFNAGIAWSESSDAVYRMGVTYAW